MSDSEKENSKPSEENSDKVKFQKLTPVSDKELTESYKEALNFIFAEKDITNIAVTGSYGSGKTSIIKSYEEHFHTKSTGKEFTYISLASFDMPPINSCSKNEPEFNTALHYLEEKVINHLVHQISPEKIPLSRFKIHRTISGKTIAGISLYFVTFLVTSYFVRDWLHKGNYNEHSPFSLAFWLFLLWFGLYKLFDHIKNHKLRKKLAYEGSEIELFDEPNDSRFDKYMNEIIYIFEQAKIETVVIEDLDRFDQCSPHLFTRLRELNLLLNKRREKNEDPIRFLYLIRDDIFTTENRTKFFDFILPIVPVITYHNSFEKAFDLFKESPHFAELNKALLRTLSLYINDLRTIKNIVNEFHIYYHPIIRKANLNVNKLLALIAYKNLFPKDFSLLLNKQGFLHEILENSSKSHSGKKDILEQFLDLSEKKHLNVINKIDENIHKLIAEALSQSKQIILADSPEQIASSYIKKLEQLDQIPCIVNGHFQIIPFKKLKHTLLSESKNQFTDKYRELSDERLDINLKYNALKKHYQNELEKSYYYNPHSLLTSDHFKKIYQKHSFNDNHVLSFESIQKLFLFLLKNHYIEKSFNEYTTHFYTYALEKDNKLFLRNFSELNPFSFTIPLNNFEMLSLFLDEADFSRQEILNFSLLDYLLTSKDSLYLPKVLNLISNIENEIFINEYLKISTYVPSLYVLLLSNVKLQTQTISDCFFDHKDISNFQKSFTILGLISQRRNSYIFEFSTPKIRRFLNTSKDFLEILEAQTPAEEVLARIFKRLDDMEISFNDITAIKYNSTVYDNIITYKMYQLNFNNILYFMRLEFKDKNLSDAELLSQNYTFLLEIPHSKIHKHIHSQLGRYMVELLNEADFFTDTFEVRDILLTNISIAFKHKMDYIEKLAPNHREFGINTWNSLFNEYSKVPEKYGSDSHKYQQQFEKICQSYRSELLSIQDFISIPNKIRELLETEFDPES